MVYTLTEGSSVEGMENLKVTKVNDYQYNLEIKGRKITLTDTCAKVSDIKKSLILVKISTIVVSVVFLLAFLVIVGTVGAFEYADYAGIECSVTNLQAFIRCALAIAIIWCSAITIGELDKVERFYVRKLRLN